jgi:Taurine catabolism dioxygenase TauD, TfdA family
MLQQPIFVGSVEKVRFPPPYTWMLLQRSQPFHQTPVPHILSRIMRPPSLAYFLIFTASASAFAPSVSQPRTASALKAAAVETPPSPLTAWGERVSDIRKLQQDYKKQKLPEFAPEIKAESLNLSGNKEAQLAYFKENAMEIKQKMQDHGAVVLRGFDLMKEQEGFQQFYNAIGMKVCQDPLQSVSARPTADGTKNSPVYEAVNKESRKNFFIGECND